MQVTRCPRQDLESHIASAHILVPLMAALDGPLLRQATKAKLVLQFGVGLEGVDIDAVSSTAPPCSSWSCQRVRQAGCDFLRDISNL